MATRVNYQPCAVCATRFPVRPQAPHAKFCSTKCRMQHHRQEKQNETQPETPQQQTINEGSKTMSQLFQPDPQQIKSLKDFAEKQYRENVEVLTEGKEEKGIYAEFVIESLQAALDRYAELLGQGYKVSPHISHVPQLISGVVYDYVTLTLQKPDSVVAEEIAAIHAAEENAYMERLAQLREAAVAAEVQSLLDRERGKRKQAELDAKAAAEQEEYNRTRAEVLQALGLGEQQ